MAGKLADRGWLDAIAVAAIGVALYVAAGALGAFMARDDFQWLNGARDLPLSYTFQVQGRTHFYRPVAELWWAGSYQVCGASKSCYHGIEIATHIVNAILFLFLSRRLFRRRCLALASAVLFVVMPAYVQAVVWVCAVTTLFAVFWYMVCVHAALSAASRERAGWHSALALVSGGAALYTHESSATLALTIPLVVMLSPDRRRALPRLVEVIGVLVLAGAFGYTTLNANAHNYVFTSGHYIAGRHALAHGLDYIRALYIGRRALPDYVGLAVAAAAIVAIGNRATRAGLGWMLLTMIPYLSFTWGNVGRYTYLPAMGFAWIVAGTILAVRDRLESRVPQRTAASIAYVVLVIVAIRFAAFSRTAIRSEVRWMDSYRQYAARVMATPGFDATHGEVVVPPPDGVEVEHDYVAPMLQWETGKRDLVVRFRSH